MSKAIMVKDDTYYLVKAYAQRCGSSLSGTVEHAIKFSIETEKAQGGNFGNNTELLELYKKTFVEKPVSDLDLFKKKAIDFINNSNMGSDSGFFKALSGMISEGRESAGVEFKTKITNFISGL